MQVAVNSVGIFGLQRPEQWKEIAAQIVHVHGKSFFTEDGTEPSIPDRELLTMLVDAGFDGYISSEWEAWHWDSCRRRRSGCAWAQGSSTAVSYGVVPRAISARRWLGIAGSRQGTTRDLRPISAISHNHNSPRSGRVGSGRAAVPGARPGPWR